MLLSSESATLSHVMETPNAHDIQEDSSGLLLYMAYKRATEEKESNYYIRAAKDILNASVDEVNSMS